MWRNYLTVGFRALAKSPLYAFINIFGLAIGLAACMALFLYVRYEQNYDRWLPDFAQTFQLQTRFETPNAPPNLSQETPYRVAGDMQRAFPQIEAVASALVRDPIVRIGGESTIVEGAWIADPTIFQVLRLPFVQGDPSTAFAEAGSAVVTESEARRLFGGQPAMGRVFTVSLAGQNVPMRITGILRDLPENTHLRVPMIVRLDRSVYASQDFLFTLWTSGTGVSYVRLRPGASAEAINAQMPAFERRNIPPNAVGNGGPQPYDTVAFSLANVRDVHLGEAQQSAQRPGNDPRRIATFAIIAALLLGISCVNFVNLTTARAGLRAKEIALRKVVGARRIQLIGQFIAESTLVTATGMLIALAMFELGSPFLRPYLADALDLHYFGSDGMLVPILGFTVAIGILSGLYPALVLSRISPTRMLKANRAALVGGGAGRLRNALVIGQFAVSIGLIICTAVIYAQTAYAMSRDPGFRSQGLLAIGSIYRSQIDDGTRRALLDRIAALPGVTAVVRANIAPPLDNHSARNFQRPGRPPQLVGDYYVAPGFFAALGTPLVAGREFSAQVARDEAPTVPYEASNPQEVAAQRDYIRRGLNIIVNETGARELGWSDPARAVGQTINADLIDTEAGLIPATIIGVVRDAQLRSAREPIEGSVFMNDPANFGTVLVRFEGVAPNALIAAMDAAWRQSVREVPLQTRLIEDSIAALYERDVLEGQMFALFAALTTLIGCLGLLGLAAFTAERRTKEIGIRKVLGARKRDIVGLLAWQFSRPVIVANLLAWPAAWWLMRDWLNGFSDRVDLSPFWFVAAGLLALVIAIGTIAGHAIKVARANPVVALRYE